MHTIFPSMPIPASTELTELLYISCRKKITVPPFALLALPSAGARGHMPPLPPTRRYRLAWLIYMSITNSFVYVEKLQCRVYL